MNRASSSAGFTLIEVVLAMSIVGLLITSLVYVQIATAERVDFAQSDVSRISESVVVLNTIEQSIRNAENVLRAGTDVLELSTRYHVDTDDELEKIYYYRSGSGLYRAVAHGAASYSAGELILDDVAEFGSRALKIKDSFDAAEYTTVVETVGRPEPVDTDVKVEYLVKELGKVDADILTTYDLLREKLAIGSFLQSQTVTVSPELERDGLLITTDFEPVSDAGDYRPIVYGEEESENTGISVVFADDNSLRIKLTKASVTIDEQVAAGKWVAGNTYRVWLEMLDDLAVVYVKDLTNDGRRQFIGKADARAIDSARVHLQTFTPGKLGRWDNLDLQYPIVDVHIGRTVSGRVEHTYGGAKQRVGQ